MAKKKMSTTRTRRSAVTTRATTTRSSATTAEQSMMTASQLSVMFALLLLANSVIIYAANLFFSNHVVLGNNMVSSGLALLYSMVVFTLIVVGLVPLIELFAQQNRMRISDMQWMTIYFVINFIGLWVVSRFAEMLGLGLSSWLVVGLIAIVLNVVQGMLVVGVVSKVK